MSEEIRSTAEARTTAALEALDLRDPREQFREWLKALRDADPAAFAAARAYYEDELLPRLADPAADPVAEWIAYGHLLARQDGPGAVVAIDSLGRARPYENDIRDNLILFLPEDPARRARILSLPRRPSRAQRASCDLLALGKTVLA